MWGYDQDQGAARGDGGAGDNSCTYACGSGAQASTPECTNGTYHGYCATQIDNGTPALVMDNSKQREAVDNPVVGWTDSSTDPATNSVPARLCGRQLARGYVLLGSDRR